MWYGHVRGGRQGRSLCRFTTNSVPFLLLLNKIITITPQLTKTHVENRADAYLPPGVHTWFSEYSWDVFQQMGTSGEGNCNSYSPGLLKKRTETFQGARANEAWLWLFPYFGSCKCIENFAVWVSVVEIQLLFGSLFTPQWLLQIYFLSCDLLVNVAFDTLV